ncbi:MAG: 4Fe-4S dicluster domain-containing protein [Desulfovibrio sp.]|uniref:4Fe-4S dicluster domain-containing protein n=1 Tax=Desulfovibrio sp. 7SRBS1 TaxID=3378064 RepID=UPI003B40C648
MEQAKQKLVVTIEEARCKGCGYCKEVCPKGVFEFEGKLNAAGYSISNPKHTELCIGCNSCVMACPDLALTLNEAE